MKIITAVVNNPTFIEIQYHTLQKYFRGEYEFIVFDDSKDFPDFTNGYDPSIKSKIQDICNQYNIQYINIPNDHHKQLTDAVIRCSDSMNFILNYQKEHPDKYLLLDSDMFLIDYFDIEKYSKFDCAIILQNRGGINYFWNGIYYFDIPKMKNLELLNWNCCPGCDVGGMMQEWLKLQTTTIPSTDEIRWTNKQFYTDTIYYIKHLWSCSWNINELPAKFKNNTKLIDFLNNDKRNENCNYFCEIYDELFLHYRAGGNWRNEGLQFHNYHTQLLKDVLLSG
jgi:hypothetical protein